MARKLFEHQGIRRRNGQLASGVTYVVYSDVAGTALADISATSGGSAIAGSAIVTADIAGLGPAAFRFYGPPSGQDTLWLRCPADASLGVQEIEADEDERLDALEAGGGGGGISGSIVDAKGDLLAATADDTIARFAAGSNGKVLATDSTQTAGLKWIVNEGPLWLTDPRVNAAGGGADDTVAVQAGLTLTDQAGALGIPPGTWKAGNLVYRNQNVVGAGRELSILKSKPGEDIFRADQTLSGSYARQRFKIADLQLLVDDSTDTSGSLGRGGVGNAALAYPMADNAVLQLRMAHPLISNVTISSVSGVMGGQNKSCGLYLQSGYDFARVIGCEITRLDYGWYDDPPDSNLASNEYANDHPLWQGLRIDGCGIGMQLVNVAYANMIGSIITLCTDGLLTVGIQSAIRNTCYVFSLDEVFIEGSTGTALTLVGEGHEAGIVQIQGPHGAVTLACSASRFRKLFVSTEAGTNTPPVLILTGHRNELDVELNGNTSAAYGRDMVSDTGRGNRVTVHRFSSGTFLNVPQVLNWDSRVAHERDAAAILLGYASEPFTSGRDLLLNPLNIRPTGTEVTDYAWSVDTTADLGSKLRIVSSTGDFFAQVFNGPNGAVAGEFLPRGKVRVYVKAKAATGGTQLWTLHKIPGPTSLGSATLTWTTSYALQSFDADLSGVAYGDALQLTVNTIGGGGAGPIDIAWVAFRPYQADLLLANKQTVTGSRGGNAALADLLTKLATMGIITDSSS